MTYQEFLEIKHTLSPLAIQVLEKDFNQQRLKRIRFIKKMRKEISERGIINVRQSQMRKVKDSGDYKFRGRF